MVGFLLITMKNNNIKTYCLSSLVFTLIRVAVLLKEQICHPIICGRKTLNYGINVDWTVVPACIRQNGGMSLVNATPNF